MSKTVEQTLLDRRCIRRYTGERISEEDMAFIYEAIRNTPTSYNGQQYTVIDVTDQELKDKIYELSHQKHVKSCDHFLVFCADYNKIEIAAKGKGIDTGSFPATTDGYTVGVVDASLALMSALVAAESRGLATCPIGYARTVAPAEMAKLLKLPKGVAVVCGLTLGVPAELPDMKPKESISLLIQHNTYSSEGMTEELTTFDDIITEYNQTRSGSKTTNDWVSHVVGYYKETESFDILQAMRQQGFLTENN